MKSKQPRDAARLEDLPNIGKQIAGELRRIGIATPAQLRKRVPLAVFQQRAATLCLERGGVCGRAAVS